MSFPENPFRTEKRASEKSANAANNGKFRPVLLCGLDAVLACFSQRPAALKSLVYQFKFNAELAPVLQWMREQNLPATLASEEELCRVAGHRFHEGVVARTERPFPGLIIPSQFEEWSRAGEKILFVENVSNPIQIGSIARVATATGLKRIILVGEETLENYFLGRTWNSAAGTLDFLTVHTINIPLNHLLNDLRPLFCSVGFTRPGGRRVDGVKPIQAPGRPLAIVIGGAETGVSPSVGGKCEHLLHIPGVGGNNLYNPADTAAYGLPWLLLQRDSLSAPKENGFLAKKRAKK